MSVTAGVSEAAMSVREKLKGKLVPTLVRRYWPGKAPDFGDDQEDDDNTPDLRTSSSSSRHPHNRNNRDSSFSNKSNDVDDPRLRRLAESRGGDRDDVRAEHRKIRQAEIVSTEEDEKEREEEREKEEDDEDAAEERRRRIKERLLRMERDLPLPTVEEEEEDEKEESEEESEYETDEESDDENEYGGRRAMAKPIFVPKAERETIAERERLEAEERALEEAVKRRMEERKVETRRIVVEKIREDEEIRRNVEAESEVADVDTDDDANPGEEYDSWKAREFARIKRDKEDREAMIKEKEEIEKVRNMSEEERREWERRNPKTGPPAKQKWRFMQKYYHKGAFFQEDADDRSGTAGSADIYRRDFSEPTGEDKLDKSILPKVMQVKHFGRSGRTKWTHLVNEDTTDWNNPWTFNDSLRNKYNAKMAGMRPIAKPKGSRKLKDWEQP